MNSLLALAALTLHQTAQWVVVFDQNTGDQKPPLSTSNDPYALLTAGVSVDRTTGDVYLLANNVGISKSTDQGKSFPLVSGDIVTGRFETSGGLNIDPAGGRLMCFTIYGSSGYSADAGKTWTRSAQGHLDYGAVDWADTGKALLSIGHESDGKLLFSQDAGATWKTLGSGYWAVGLFNHNTLLATLEHTPGIERSTDAGQTWAKVSDESPTAPVMVEFKGTGYWLTENGLLTSRNKGATWRLVGPTPKGATLGPLFGKDARHIVVGSPDGLFETDNGGKSWSLAAPLAPEIKILKAAKYGTYGWDPIHNIFYTSQMSKPAYKYVVTNRPPEPPLVCAPAQMRGVGGSVFW